MLAEPDPVSLAQVARRLVPVGMALRWDRRVDGARRVRGVYGHWETLLFDMGLAWARQGDELHVRPAGLAPGDVQLASVEHGVAEWRVKGEETLLETLERWGARAGVDVLWLTDRTFRLHESRTFRGTYREAVQALMFSLSDLDRAPAAELSEDRRTLSVMHRARRRGPGG